MSPNNADGMVNSVDPDQTAPLGAVWSGSALFAQAYLSENLGTLRYVCCIVILHPFICTLSEMTLDLNPDRAILCMSNNIELKSEQSV